MSAFAIALLVGLSAGAWVYSRIYNRTGGNQTSALVTAGVCGATAVLVIFVILSVVLPE